MQAMTQKREKEKEQEKPDAGWTVVCLPKPVTQMHATPQERGHEALPVLLLLMLLLLFSMMLLLFMPPSTPSHCKSKKNSAHIPGTRQALFLQPT